MVKTDPRNLMCLQKTSLLNPCGSPWQANEQLQVGWDINDKTKRRGKKREKTRIGHKNEKKYKNLLEKANTRTQVEIVVQSYKIHNG